ncbi:MAG: sigma 54-interacting transcriptional regulator [Planctomycetes bacterium]|nr:sigma 54-interacting transcriptional regulator [Planctomycetota bacterium]
MNEKREKLRILAIEDNPADFRLIKEFLSENHSTDFELTHAENLKDASGFLSKQKFDAVLLDLNLPDSTGVENIDKLYADERDFPIIVLTGLEDEKTGISAVQKGAQEYLVKGKIHSDSLIRCIRYAIERKKREAELHKLNRTLKALSNSDQAMMHAINESVYMGEVCKIVVKDCGYKMVWIGFAENDEEKRVLPVAYAGFEEGYIEGLKLTWADTELGRGPTGTAIRTGKPSICANMLTDPHFKPWREEALKRGYASSIVLPLITDGKPFGALNIYSSDPEAFSEDEVKLLAELASDLAYGITSIRLRLAIHKSEQKFRAIFESMPDGIVIVDKNRHIKATNKSFERLFDISKKDFIDKRWGDALKCVNSAGRCEQGDLADLCRTCDIRTTIQDALAGKSIHQRKAIAELMVSDKLQKKTLLLSAAPLEYEGEGHAIVILEDITELDKLQKRLKVEHSFAGIIGHDIKMQELYDNIKELAESGVSVLIQGESGTGKELVASAIHNEGPRADKQFVPVNCGALPDGLLESELFGHVKGAFTGAIRDKKGRFELADGGTIFLDEIGDLSQAMQVKLLRVLQSGTFEKVGGEKTIKVDVRVISATNKSLNDEIKAGRFREDLFYRLSVVPLNMPPLRERPNDIPHLCEHFLKKDAEETGRDKASLSPESLDILIDYKWPGNVRELQNALQFALVKSRGGVIQPQHLPPQIQKEKGIPSISVKRRRKRKLDLEAVKEALRQTKGNKLKATKVLGVSRATLHRFLAEEKQTYQQP